MKGKRPGFRLSIPRDPPMALSLAAFRATVRARRIERGFSRRKFASVVDVCPAYLSLVETGKAEYPPSSRARSSDGGAIGCRYRRVDRHGRRDLRRREGHRPRTARPDPGVAPDCQWTVSRRAPALGVSVVDRRRRLRMIEVRRAGHEVRGRHRIHRRVTRYGVSRRPSFKMRSVPPKASSRCSAT